MFEYITEEQKEVISNIGKVMGIPKDRLLPDDKWEAIDEDKQFMDFIGRITHAEKDGIY